MNVDTATIEAPATTTTTPARLRHRTVKSGLVGATVTTASAAAMHAAGVSFEIEGEMIPLLGFAQMTFVGAVIGGLLLAGLNRWSDRAHSRFVQVSVALTALSCVPSVTVPDDAASKIALVFVHVLAAAIIIPALARQRSSV